ncbi:condensation domain-containing protein [Streptomyces spiralis]
MNSSAAEPSSAEPSLVPLSPAQEAMWLEQLLHPESVNGGFFSVLLRGPVTAEEVRTACAAVCAGHPQLRSLVVADGPAVRMAVHPVEAVLRFARVPLAAGPGQERAAARRWYRAERTGPWDLTGAAPIAFWLLEHGPGRCTLVVGVHHIAFDGRSKFVFARQFLAALRRLREGAAPAPDGPHPLPVHPPVDAELAQVLEYWLNADLPGLPGLSLPRDDLRTAQGAAPVHPTARFDLPAETGARLRALTRESGASLFTGLLAGVAARLHEYGNERFVLGIPVDTSLPGTREHIGLQVNVVPCLVEIPPAVTFRQLITVCRDALEVVRRFRRVPFSWVLRELRQRYGVDVTQGAFDRVGVSYPAVTTDLGDVPGVETEWDFFAPNSTRSFELILQLRREGEAVYGRLDFSTAVLSSAAADSLVAGYTRLLTEATARPDLPLTALMESHLTAPAAGDRACGAVGGPVEDFRPTREMAALSRTDGALRLELRDPVLGPLGSCAWHADDPLGLWLTHPAPGLRFRVTTTEGRALPRGVPGVLGHSGDPRPGRFRAWIDDRDRVRLLGTVERTYDWVGRRVESFEAVSALAALPGVRHVALDLGRPTPSGGPPRPRVDLTLAPDAPTDPRAWRRLLRRSWPAGWPAPTEIVLHGPDPARDMA